MRFTPRWAHYVVDMQSKVLESGYIVLYRILHNAYGLRLMWYQEDRHRSVTILCYLYSQFLKSNNVYFLLLMPHVS